jgi:hypothetical protein
VAASRLEYSTPIFMIVVRRKLHRSFVVARRSAATIPVPAAVGRSSKSAAARMALRHRCIETGNQHSPGLPPFDEIFREVLRAVRAADLPKVDG